MLLFSQNARIGLWYAQHVDVDSEGTLQQRGHALLDERAELARKKCFGYREVDVGGEEGRDGAIWKKSRRIDANGGGVG